MLFVYDEAKAGDKEDVLAIMDGFYTALNTGDFDALEILPHTRFNRDGSLLESADPEKIKAWLASSGVKWNIQTHHSDVKIYGDTAVFAAYESVSITPPNGKTRRETNRLTVVFAKQKGEWK
ncbi:MAG TPA: hypothetical protein EYG11_03385 [Candidatus Latescibacteria bacterium]|nr:hypothetical protein [Candidatus Latescibacterota bacterium]